MSQRGLSLVELLVSLAIGMVTLATATKLYVDYLQATKRSLLNARISQDLHASAGLMVRELRRAGYWAGSATQRSGARNPYDQVKASGTSVMVGYDRDATQSEQLAAQTGFRLQDGVLQMRSVGQQGSAGWQALTDPAVLQVTRLSVEHHRHEVEVYGYCSCLATHRCTEAELAADPNWPRLVVHQFDTVLQARARHDASVQREVRDTVGARNEQLEGRCP